MADDEGSDPHSREDDEFLRAVAASPARPPESARGANPATVAHFKVVSRLGSGGMGVVYRALDETLRRDVALKLLPPANARDPERRKRFLREARVAASLVHPNIAVVYQVGEADGRVYIALELVEGTTLRARLAKGALPPATAREWAVQMALGLAAAHEKGIVHRDLKPENVMVTPADVVKLLDFGLAKSGWAPDSDLGTADTEAQITREGEILGSSAYMSPEQALGLVVDARSDVFSFGIVFYEMLCGRRPFSGKTPGEVRAAIARDEPAPVDTAVDPALAEVAFRCLAKKVDDRFADAAAILSALVQLAPSGDEIGRSGRMHGAVSNTLRPSKPAGRRTRSRTLVAALVAGVAVAGGVAAYGAAHAPHVRHCITTIDTSDGPRCAHEVEVNAKTRRGRTPLHRLTERNGRVIRDESVDFANVVETRDEIARDESGAVRDVSTFDEFGRNVQRQKWSDGGRHVDLVEMDGKTPRHLRDADRPTAIQREFDADGRLRRELFQGPTGRPRPRRHDSYLIKGAYGDEREYGPTAGVYTAFTVLGADGAPGTNDRHFSRMRQKDTGSLWGDMELFDRDDRPITAEGYHTLHLVHDECEPIGQVFYGLHGEPATYLVETVHELRDIWDPVKRQVEQTIFDEQGRPQLVRGIWILADRQTFDEHGRLVLIEYLDGQGNRIIAKTGSSALRFVYDDRDREVLREQLDPSGGLMQGQEGYARRETRPDERNNPLEYRYYDETGHLAPSKEGGAIVRSTFDERDLRLTSSSFDADDRPVANVHGVWSEHSKYDRLRNLIETAYFGPDGKPAVSDEGFAVKRLSYDENDDLVAVSYFDASGAPTPFESSYATKRIKNDERGLPIEEAFLDVHGNPVLVKGGYTSLKRRLDREGDVIEEAYFGKRGEPVLRDGGFARKTTAYDATRNPVEVALFDVAGEPVRGSAGWAIERTAYDERKLVVRIDHLDASGAPALDATGRASVAKTNDSRANVVEETSLDAAGKPVVTADGGYATKKTKYDERDEIVEEALLGADGKPTVGKSGWSFLRTRYDDFGDVIEEAFFDGASEPIAPKDLAYASRRQRFDARHRLVEASYFDLRGAPTKGPEGTAIVRYERDGYGRAVQTRYFDGMGVAAPSQKGRIVVRAKYDDAGRLLDERFVDAAGNPLPAADGCAGRHTTYDALGRKAEESCLDAKESPALSADGWAIRRTLHDAHGNDVEVTTYGPDGALRNDKAGVARLENRFDERNLLVETTFFDARGEPAHDKRGAHVLRFTYDDEGKKTGERGFDEHERAVAVKASAARADLKASAARADSKAITQGP